MGPGSPEGPAGPASPEPQATAVQKRENEREKERRAWNERMVITVWRFEEELRTAANPPARTIQATRAIRVSQSAEEEVSSALEGGSVERAAIDLAPEQRSGLRVVRDQPVGPSEKSLVPLQRFMIRKPNEQTKTAVVCCRDVVCIQEAIGGDDSVESRTRSAIDCDSCRKIGDERDGNR